MYKPGIILSEIVAILVATTFTRNLAWQDDVTLWDDVARKSLCKARPSYELGKALTAQGRYEEAIQKIQSALKLDPDYVEAHNSLGVVYMRLNMDNEAIRQFNIVLSLNPGYDHAYISLGVLFLGRGCTDEARREFIAALNANPVNQEAL